MNPDTFKNYFFESPLFSVTKANREQLKLYSLATWPAQVSFIIGLPGLVGVITKKLGRLALDCYDPEEEKRLKKILRFMFPAVIDEMGLGRDPYGMMHHDLFAKQVEEFTGVTPEDMRRLWICNPASQKLSRCIAEAMENVREGLHMMYVFETLAPRFFKHQEAIFLNSGLAPQAIHSTLHQYSEQNHADEAAQFAELLEIDDELVTKYIKLWRDYVDELYFTMMQGTRTTETDTRASLAH